MCRMKVMVRLRPSLYETYKSESLMPSAMEPTVCVSVYGAH